MPPSLLLSLSSDEYKMKGVEEVKYMRGEENRVNARNQENLVRTTGTFSLAYTRTQQVEANMLECLECVGCSLSWFAGKVCGLQQCKAASGVCFSCATAPHCR